MSGKVLCGREKSDAEHTHLLYTTNLKVFGEVPIQASFINVRLSRTKLNRFVLNSLGNKDV